jgi:hypothetical protein
MDNCLSWSSETGYVDELDDVEPFSAPPPPEAHELLERLRLFHPEAWHGSAADLHKRQTGHRLQFGCCPEHNTLDD